MPSGQATSLNEAQRFSGEEVRVETMTAQYIVERDKSMKIGWPCALRLP